MNAIKGTRRAVTAGARIERWVFHRYEFCVANPVKAWAIGLGVTGLAYYSLHLQHSGEAVSSNSNYIYHVRDGVKGPTAVVSTGECNNRQDSWELRNMERNYSIMTQDHHRQLDDVKYRYERSKDNDYSRQDIKTAAKS